MKVLVLMLVITMLSCSTNRQNQHADKKDKPKTDTLKCISSFTVEHAGGKYDFRNYETQGLVKSVDFSTAKTLVFPEVDFGAANFSEKLIAIDTTLNKLCVNATYFSDLAMADATRLQDKHTIGEIKSALIKKINYSQLIAFLLKTEIIESYWHLSADICLEKESEYGDYYEANVSAVHHYCTNECIDQPYKFTILINKKTGLIHLQP